MQTARAKKILGRLLSLLRVRTTAAGFEVSDQVVRIIYPEKKTIGMAAVVLGPGVMERGVIKDPAAFTAALAALRAKMPARMQSKKMNVVVTLSSASIYTQSFTLPLIEGDELKKAIDLNIQMSSPDDLARSYYGTRVLARDEVNGKIEISAAFIEKGLVDGIVEALFTTGFITTCVESRAISLVRVVKERFPSADPANPYLLLDIDGVGIDVLIIKKNELYFEYATPWSDVADDKGQVTMEKFADTITASLRQVSNFYRQRWQDPLGGVIVSASAFSDQAATVAAEALGLPILPLAPSVPEVGEGAVSPEWFVVVGADLRGSSPEEDHEINLAGVVAAERYEEERMLLFLEFWRIIVPAALAICVATLVLGANFLTSMATRLQTNAPVGAAAQTAQMSALEASSTAFNQEVQLVLAAQAKTDQDHLILDDLQNIAATSSVSISHLTFQGANAPISLSGIATTENDIVEFKNLIEGDKKFGTVDLPLSQIQPAGTAYSFSMTFPLAQ